MPTKPMRRSFTDEQKRAIVAEASRPGSSVAKVLSKHKIAESNFYNWKKKFRTDTTAASPTSQRASAQVSAGAERATPAKGGNANHIARALQELRATKVQLSRELQRVTRAIEVLEAR